MTSFRVGSASDVGQIRSNNQDSKLVADAVSVFAVADGMGGHQGGEVASAIAVETLEAIITEPTTASVVEAVKEANRRIFSRAADSAELRGMGTTLVAIALVDQGADDEEVAWVNVGDSRVYLLRDGELHQLSRDHSLVEDLRRGGQLTEEEAAVHPQRNILTRALGIDSEVEVDHGAVVPLQADRYLLCSDGLFNEVDRPTLVEILTTLEDPEEAANGLVRLANAGGGRDNITCVVVDVVDDGGRSARAAEAAAIATAMAPEGEVPAGDGAPATEGPAPVEAVAPTVEMPAVTAAEAAQPEPPPEAEAEAETGLPPEASPPTRPGLGPPPAPPAVPTTEATPPGPPPETPVAAAPPPGSTSGAAPVAGFPTEDDNDGPADEEFPFGRPTTDVFGDIDKAKGRHWVVTVGVVVVVLALLLGGSYLGLGWYADRTYFVGTQGEQVVVFRGQPGGFVVFDPSVEEDFGGDVVLDDLPADAVADVEANREFSSRANAVSFVNTSVQQAAAAEPDEEPAPTTTTTEGEPTTTTSGSTTTGGATTTPATPTTGP